MPVTLPSDTHNRGAGWRANQRSAGRSTTLPPPKRVSPSPSARFPFCAMMRSSPSGPWPEYIATQVPRAAFATRRWRSSALSRMLLEVSIRIVPRDCAARRRKIARSIAQRCACRTTLPSADERQARKPRAFGSTRLSRARAIRTVPGSTFGRSGRFAGGAMPNGAGSMDTGASAVALVQFSTTRLVETPSVSSDARVLDRREHARIEVGRLGHGRRPAHVTELVVAARRKPARSPRLALQCTFALLYASTGREEEARFALAAVVERCSDGGQLRLLAETCAWLRDAETAAALELELEIAGDGNVCLGALVCLGSTQRYRGLVAQARRERRRLRGRDREYLLLRQRPEQ
jgi:hypothetical protein